MGADQKIGDRNRRSFFRDWIPIGDREAATETGIADHPSNGDQDPDRDFNF